ncbi:MAG: hypothetical protein IH591_15765 [Bacteroidales bacterium]|nr:hypothetical protein [Bacteroidales bacterium]
MSRKIILRLFVCLLAVMSFMTVTGQTEDIIAQSDKLNYDRLPGFISITELSGGPGISLTDAPYAKYYFGITTIAGYQFTRNLTAGGGTGLHFHNDGTFLPLFLDARFSLNANDFVPYFGAAGGVAFNLSDPDSRTWIFINPSIGIRWVAADRRSVSFSAGLMTMSGKVNRNSFINFKLGLGIKGK